MVEPADGFSLRRAFDREVWKLCELDAEVKIAIDNTIVLDGFIDDRARAAAAGTISIAGRDKAGRLVQESIPIGLGLRRPAADRGLKRLASPWFTTVTLSDARNRSVRRGKGHRAPAGEEPAVFNVKGKLDEEHGGRDRSRRDAVEHDRAARLERRPAVLVLGRRARARDREAELHAASSTSSATRSATARRSRPELQRERAGRLRADRGARAGAGDDGDYGDTSRATSAREGRTERRRHRRATSAIRSASSSRRPRIREQRRGAARGRARDEAPQLQAAARDGRRAAARPADRRLDHDALRAEHARARDRRRARARRGLPAIRVPLRRKRDRRRDDELMCVPRGTEFVA
jgi:hypothetical protein